MKKPRVIMTAAVVAGLLVAFVYLPLPFHISCQLEVQPSGAVPVFPRTPGRIVEVLAHTGTKVNKDMVLARLENTDLELQVMKLKAELSDLQTELDSLDRQRYSDENASLRIPAVRELLQMKQDQLGEKLLELNGLTIKAPSEGYVFPPAVRPVRDTGDGRLPQWSGSPFDRKNVGALMTGADQICQIGKSTDYEAVLVVDQADVDLVERYFIEQRKGPDVQVKLDAYRWKTIDGTISQLASSPMEATPASLATQGGGELETKTDKKSGTLKTISTSYQARVALNDNRQLLRVGLTGKAKIYTGWQSLYDRTKRFVMRTFHFDW